MSLLIHGQPIRSVAVIDDNADARESTTFVVKDAEMDAVPLNGPLESIGATLTLVETTCQAVICDHNLDPGGYAEFSGARFVASCYDRGIPAVLATRWGKADVAAIRPLKPKIPAMITPDELSQPAQLIRALEICVRELEGRYDSDRHPWRALVRIIEVGDQQVVLTVPAWQHDEYIALSRDEFPPEYRGALTAGARLHALINLGASRADDLFFGAWEPS